MKYAMKLFLTLTTFICLTSDAFAEGDKTGRQSAAPYSTMEPAAGDPSRKANLDMRDVEVMQRTLNDKGYSSGPEDGIFGPMTKGALRRFQRDNGLEASGQPTSQTLTKLGLYNKKAPSDNTRNQNMDNPPGSYRSDEQYTPY